MMRGLSAVILVLLLVSPSCLFARTWYIKPDGTGDAPTLSAGEDSAAHGDTLLLADGTFTGAENKGVYVHNKRVCFISESGNPQACVINCGGGGTCITYGGWEGPDGYGFAPGKIKGIKITGASTAVLAFMEASAWLEDCIITGNNGVALDAVGVPANGYGFVGATGCVFKSNPAGVISCGFKCTANVTDCVFYNNGRVLYVDEQGWATVTGCTMAANSGGTGGVISTNWYGYAIVRRSIVAFNNGNAIGCNISDVAVECCDVYGNDGDYVGCIAGQSGINGNISVDPKFCSLGGRNFGLMVDSPCLPGSHPDGFDCGLIGALPQGCDDPATEPVTWGAIKALYE